jgi:hypothetical protein
MIAIGADIHSNKDRALRYASSRGQLEIVKELLNAGADIHAEYLDAPSPTALEGAKRKGYQEIVDFLEDYIANEKKSKHRTVRESLLEKFVEDSDPVADMGIGMLNKHIDFKDYVEFYTFLYNFFFTILGFDKLPPDFIDDTGTVINNKYFHILADYIKTYITVDGNTTYCSTPEIKYWTIGLKQLVLQGNCDEIDKDKIIKTARDFYNFPI